MCMPAKSSPGEADAARAAARRDARGHHARRRLRPDQLGARPQLARAAAAPAVGLGQPVGRPSAAAGEADGPAGAALVVGGAGGALPGSARRPVAPTRQPAASNASARWHAQEATMIGDGNCQFRASYRVIDGVFMFCALCFVQMFFAIFCILFAAFATPLIILDPFGAFWCLLEPFGILWRLLEPFGAFDPF